MLYFFQGTEELFISQKIQSLIDKQPPSHTTLHFSAVDTPCEQLMFEMCSEDLFTDTKIIILKELELIDFALYFAHMNSAAYEQLQESTNILIMLYKKNEALTKTATKVLAPLLQSATKIDVMSKNNDFAAQFIIDWLTQHQIAHNLTKKEAIDIAAQFHNNLELIQKECDRILLEQKSAVSHADFQSDTKFLEVQIFDFIATLEQKEQVKTFTILENLLLHQQNTFAILALLLKNYKEMYQIQSLIRVGYNSKQIATRLSIHPYRTTLLVRQASKIPMASFPIILEAILATETNLKTGSIPEIALKNLAIILLTNGSECNIKTDAL